MPGTSVAEPRQLGVGIMTTYLSGPLTLVVPTASPTPNKVTAVGHLFDATVLAWMGVTPGFEIGVAVPFTAYRDGLGISPLTSEHSASLPAFGLRDIRLGATYALVDTGRPDDGARFRLAGRLELSLPTGHREAFATNGGLVAVPTLTSSVELGRIFFQGGVGARLRGTEDLVGMRVGPQAWVGLGGGLSFDRANHYQVAVEAFMLPTLSSQGVSTPATIPGATRRGEGDAGALIPSEWLASFRIVLPIEARSISVLVGAGGPIQWGSQTALLPEARFALGLRYAPAEAKHPVEVPPGISY